MKLTFFLVVIGFCYCVSYEGVDDDPGDREVARMVGQSYNDLGQMQLERDSEINTPNMDQFFLKIKDKKIKEYCAKGETTGGCSLTPPRLGGGKRKKIKIKEYYPEGETTGDSAFTQPRLGGGEYEHTLDPAIFGIVKRLKNICCTEKTGDCAIYLGRYLRSDPKRNNVRSTRKMGNQNSVEIMSNSDEKTGGSNLVRARFRRKNPYYYQDKTLKKKIYSSPDYVNLDARYFADDYQS